MTDEISKVNREKVLSDMAKVKVTTGDKELHDVQETFGDLPKEWDVKFVSTEYIAVRNKDGEFIVERKSVWRRFREWLASCLNDLADVIEGD